MPAPVRKRLLRPALFVLFCLVLVAGTACLMGCVQIQVPSRVHQSTSIILEAEDGGVEAPMVIEDFKPVVDKILRVQKASGGKCVHVPVGQPTYSCSTPKAQLKGKVRLKFSVPQDGKYYVYLRICWGDTCICRRGLSMLLDDRKPIEVDDAFPSFLWHWFRFLPHDISDTNPLAFTLTKGEHSLIFSGREDDARLDQVFITDDPDDRPAGIMKQE